jgi:hypothetical protein
MDSCQGSSVPEGVVWLRPFGISSTVLGRDKKLTPVQEIDPPSVPTAEFEDEDDNEDD